MGNYKNVTYALVGHPVGHSFSADFFNNKFVEEGIPDEYYAAFDIDDFGKFPELLQAHKQLKGFNVTSPWKEEVIDFLDDIHPDAQDISAVNCVKIICCNGYKKLIGYNTDIYGFRESLFHFLSNNIMTFSHSSNYDFRDIRALILGTGGASRAVRKALEQLGIQFLTVSRNSSKGLTYDRLGNDIVGTHKLIINATKLGMGELSDVAPSIPYDAVGPDHFCYDLIYNPAQTEFLRRCEERGARVKNGLEMLHLQALESWNIWTGRM